MQNLKLFAFAMLGAGLLGIHVTTSTGCEASAEATGGASGSGDAGTSAAGTTAAGSGGSDAAGSGGSDAAGSGGSGGSGPSSTSGASLAAALKADAACQACLDGLSGSVKDGAGADVTCDGIIGKCDGDKTCQDYIASIKDAGMQGSDTDPNCWTEAAGVALSGGNTITNELTICAVASCGGKCGNLSFAAPTGCD